jgi:zinc metalloprotease ZmpB
LNRFQIILLYFFLKSFALAANNNLVPFIKHEASTTFSYHITYGLFYQNKEVIGAMHKINKDKCGKILSEVIAFPKAELFNNISKESIVKADCFFYNLDEVYACKKNLIKSDLEESIILIDLQTGAQVIKLSNAQYLKDSVVSVSVFLPDPVTKAEVLYGGSYADNADLDDVVLNNEMYEDTISANYNDVTQLFSLQNKYVRMTEKSAPSILSPSSLSPIFKYSRSADSFEDVNAYYHLTKQCRYYDSLGYSPLNNKILEVDAHGLNGEDNSVFFAGVTPTLVFGEGGVDDAEDADVIIHELTHAVSWTANGNDLFNEEREALDEGIADYFATSYSRALNDFNWQNVYSWDGHNEFWDGRSANTINNYSVPFGLGKYAGGEVFNTALQYLWKDAGKVATDRLVLQALYSINGYTKFSDAAYYIWQADSLLNQGKWAQHICDAFAKKNIDIPFCKAQIPIDSNVQILNQISAAHQSGKIRITGLLPNNTYQMGLYNILGQLLLNWSVNNQTQSEFEFPYKAPSFYFLKISMPHQSKTFKIPDLK